MENGSPSSPLKGCWVVCTFRPGSVISVTPTWMSRADLAAKICWDAFSQSHFVILELVDAYVKTYDPQICAFQADGYFKGPSTLQCTKTMTCQGQIWLDFAMFPLAHQADK